jgi:hypothetical protein
VAEEKPVHKDDNKIQTPPRKSSASAPSDDSDRVVNKRSSSIRRTSSVLSNPNITNLLQYRVLMEAQKISSFIQLV